MTRFLLRFAALTIFFANPVIVWSQDFTRPIYTKTPRQGTFPIPGDFNGDSKTDLAYWTSEPDLDLYVLYNNGDQDYTKSVFSVEGVTVLNGLEVGDFNADGKDDILAFQTTAQGSKILLLASTGTSFTQSTIAADLPLIGSLQVVKFDSDEHLDFIAGFSVADVMVFKGDGSGNFSSSTETGTPGARNIRYVDLNNDELMDFVGLNNATLKIYVKEEDGTYTASEKTLDQFPVDFEVLDFDGDGFADIAASILNSSNGRIDIYKNAGGATFPTVQSIATSRQPFTLAHADFDDDGREDLAASSYDRPSVLIYHNAPAGFENRHPSHTKGNGNQGILFADMNGDDVPELVELRQQEINIYAVTQTGEFALDHTIILHFLAANGIIVDMNNDGHNDIVAPSSNAISVQYGNGDFTFDPPVYTRTIGDIQPHITVADFNNDGFMDVVYTGYSETGIMLSDNGVLQEPQQMYFGDMFHLVSADFNKDGNMDFAGQNTLMLGDGAGNFTQEYTDMVDLSSIDVGYFNDDDLPDLVMTALDGVAYVGLNTGSTPIFPFTDVMSDVTNLPLMIAGDVNKDGFDDFILGGTFLDKLSIFVNNGDGTFTPKDVELASGNGVFAAMPPMVDLNDDGRMDLVAPYSNLPLNGGFAIFIQNTDGEFELTNKIDVDPMQAPSTATIGDLNGDQKIDILAFDLNSVNAMTIVPSFYQPAVPPSALTASEITGTTVKLSLQKSNGTGRIIFVRKADVSITPPADNTKYEADDVWGSGTGPAEGIFAVVTGDVTEVTVTGLTKGTAYIATAFEYSENIAGTKIDYLATPAEVQFTTTKDQTITVTPPGDKTVGTPFDLAASASSGLPLVFEPITSNISLEGNTVTLLSPGPATIKISQAGNSEFSPVEKEITFCVIPPVPTISVEDHFGGKYTLTSSSDSNNQWLLNGEPIADATAKTLEPAQDGVYSVKVDYSGCSSTSQPTSYLITGFKEHENDFIVYPNPIRDIFSIQTGSLSITSTDVLFTDVTGRQHFFNGRQEGANRMTVNIGSTLVRGMYVIELQTNIGAFRTKVVID